LRGWDSGLCPGINTCTWAPTWHHAAHVRLHFFLNAALAGGLLLLERRGGAGAFALDAVRRKKRA